MRVRFINIPRSHPRDEAFVGEGDTYPVSLDDGAFSLAEIHTAMRDGGITEAEVFECELTNGTLRDRRPTGEVFRLP